MGCCTAVYPSVTDEFLYIRNDAIFKCNVSYVEYFCLQLVYIPGWKSIDALASLAFCSRSNEIIHENGFLTEVCYL